MRGWKVHISTMYGTGGPQRTPVGLKYLSKVNRSNYDRYHTPLVVKRFLFKCLHVADRCRYNADTIG